jgi:hypothetical protein
MNDGALSAPNQTSARETQRRSTRPRKVRAVVRQGPQRAVLQTRNREHQQRSTGGNNTRQPLPRVVVAPSECMNRPARTSEDDAEGSNPPKQPAYQSRRFHAVSVKRHPSSRHGLLEQGTRLWLDLSPAHIKVNVIEVGIIQISAMPNDAAGWQ